MATGGHWIGGSVGSRGDQHFGDEEDLMEGGPALLIGGEIELDCEDEVNGCSMPGANPWATVEIAGDIDFGGEGPVARLRGWWAKRQAARLAALAPKRRRPAPAVAKAQTLAARPVDSGDSETDRDITPSSGLAPMQDMDSEVEALAFAVQNDPYALGQAL